MISVTLRMYFEILGKHSSQTLAARGMKSCSDSGLNQYIIHKPFVFFQNILAIILKQIKVTGFKKKNKAFVRNRLHSFKFTLKFVKFIVLGQYADKLNASQLLLRWTVILSIYKLCS